MNDLRDELSKIVIAPSLTQVDLCTNNAGLFVVDACFVVGLKQRPLHPAYNLIVPDPESAWNSESIQRLAGWLAGGEARALLGNPKGFDLEETGRVVWVDKTRLRCGSDR